MASPGRGLFPILAAVALVACKGDSLGLYDNPYPQSSPMHESFGSVTAKIKAHPKLNAQLGQAKTGVQAVAIGDRLVQKGMAKLDDSSLLKLAKVIPDVLDGMSNSACGKLTQGKGGSGGRANFIGRLLGVKTVHDEFLAALEKAGAEKGGGYLNLVYLALEKAVDDPYTPPPPHPEEIRAALGNLLGGRFTPEQRSDLIRTLTSGRLAKEEDFCWAVKALYANIAVTPSNHRRVILRFMATGA